MKTENQAAKEATATADLIEKKKIEEEDRDRNEMQNPHQTCTQFTESKQWKHKLKKKPR